MLKRKIERLNGLIKELCKDFLDYIGENDVENQKIENELRKKCRALTWEAKKNQKTNKE